MEFFLTGLFLIKITFAASNVLAGVRPILHSILLKCADGQKRMAELSLETITELCLEQTFQLDHCGQKQRYVSCSSRMCV